MGDIELALPSAWGYMILLKVRGSCSTSRNQINLLYCWLRTKQGTYLKPQVAFKHPRCLCLLFCLLTQGEASDDTQLCMSFLGFDDNSLNCCQEILEGKH